MVWAVRCGGASPTYISLYYSYNWTGNFNYELDIVRRGDVVTAGSISGLISNDTDTSGFYFNGQTLISYDAAVSVTVSHVANERFILKLERISGTLRIYKNGVQIHSQSYATNPTALVFVGTGNISMDIARIIMVNGGQNFNAYSDLSGGTGTVIPYQSSGGGITVPLQLVNPLSSDASWVTVADPGYTTKPLKYWNGSAWVTKPLKYWNGSAWVTKPLKVFI